MDTLTLRVAARYKSKKKTDEGNTVYLYSERQIQDRNRKKAERLEKLSKSIHKLRAQVKKDLGSSDSTTARTALVVALIDETFERVGNDESADEGHFGVTGWQKSHVSFGKGKATIKYVGKAGVKQEKTVSDKAVVTALRKAYDECEGDCIFSHDSGKITASKVNDYLSKFDITAKDLRGFHANREMQERLRAARKGKLSEDKKEREKQLKSEFKEALEATAKAVGHEPSTLKSQYLVPSLEDKFLADGTVMDRLKEASLAVRVAQRYPAPLSSDPIALSVARRIQADGMTRIDLDEAWVAKMRQDFLTLIKNLSRVHDYETAVELRQAFITYRERFREFFFDRFLRDSKESVSPAIGAMLRKPAWDFYLELTVPIENANNYYSETARFDEFERASKPWDKRLRTKAQVFWRKLNDILSARNEKRFVVKVPTSDRLVLEGFQAEVTGFDADNEHDRDYLERLKEGLRVYRRRAGQTMPILLKKQLPLHVKFDSKLGEGGKYFGSFIMVAPDASAGDANPQAMTHIVAHEMGHHIFKTVLSKNAQDFWESAIAADYGPLDLGELLSKWHGTMSAAEFVEHLALRDPVLALQVDLLHWWGDNSERDERNAWLGREDFQEAYDSGKRTVAVPKSPITAYAGKNGEEAFCEAVGRLVAYGPGALLPIIKHWLNIILPGDVKLASKIEARVAARYRAESR